MSILALQAAYDEVIRTNGLIQLTRELREDDSIKKDRVIGIFTGLPLWERIKQSGGHATFKHALTGIVVGVQAHGGNDMQPNHAETLLEAVQDHMNIFHNTVFQFTPRGWTHQPPDWGASLHRYIIWSNNH